MRAVKNSPKAYIDACEARMKKNLAAYKPVKNAAGGQADKFEPQFFAHLTLVLDHYFVHRTRGIEGKDGNPLNEVRMCRSPRSTRPRAPRTLRPPTHELTSLTQGRAPALSSSPWCRAPRLNEPRAPR